MPLLDFKCDNCGVQVERMVPLREFDFAQRCNVCGHVLRQIMPRFPGVSAQFTASGIEDERIYRTHNVTRPTAMPGMKAFPLSPSDGCHCGNCSAHLRRASITSAAEPGKVR